MVNIDGLLVHKCFIAMLKQTLTGNGNCMQKELSLYFIYELVFYFMVYSFILFFIFKVTSKPDRMNE